MTRAGERPTILAYYFPSWHKDTRNEAWFGEGWTEWELVANARPRFEGHRQPRQPALGAIDEADPSAFERQITMAHDHGVDGFIFDFYWYDDGPYLSRALDEGYLGSSNAHLTQFALMWANHNLTNIFPSPSPGADHRVLKHGGLDRAAFERMATHVVSTYFLEPNYLTIDGRPWFSIYEVGSLISGLGGVKEAREALQWFDGYAKSQGLPGVHFDAVVWGFDMLPNAVRMSDPNELIKELGFDSATSYVWIHHLDAEAVPFPTGPWKQVEDLAFSAYENYESTLSVPFYPNITVGWDASPRTAQLADFEQSDYPWMPVWDPSPSEFERGLVRARDFLSRHRLTSPMITINAWNEWTEGSALLPDTVNGMGFLEAIFTVFGPTASNG